MSEKRDEIKLDPSSFTIEDDVFEKETPNPLDKLSENERNYLLGIGSILGNTMDEMYSKRLRDMQRQMERQVQVVCKVFNIFSEQDQLEICAKLSDDWRIVAEFQHGHSILIFMGKELWIPVEEKKPEEGETPPPAKD